MTEVFSFNNPNASDREITQYINQRENIIIISFISPQSGIPHMCPVWGIFTDERFYFQTEDYSYKVKFIKKGNDKIGVSITDPKLFPDYSKNSIPYISFGGPASIHTKENFPPFVQILKQIFLKYIMDEKERKNVTNFVLKEVKTRVLVEVLPEWIKVAKVPGD